MVVEEEEEARDLEAVLEAAQVWLAKTRVLKKKPAQWFFLGFLGFFGFFYIIAQKREFLGFFQSQEYFLVYPDFKL